MSSAVTSVFSQIEQNYIEWLSTTEKLKEVDYKIEDLSFKIIFKMTYTIYPMKDCPTPTIIPNSVNVSSEDLRIKDLFSKHLKTSQALYYFPSDKNEVEFELRYFKNLATMNEQLLMEDTKHPKQKSHRWHSSILKLLK